MCNLDDRETVDLISENIYMQYFPGYSGYTNEKPFDASLFVDFRKRLGIDNVNAINERIVALKTRFESHPSVQNESNSSIDSDAEHDNRDNDSTIPPGELPHKGRVIFDATACPQDIAYPTDLALLNDAREKVEELVSIIYDPNLHGTRPRLYQQKTRILRGKQLAKVEFGAKIHLSVIDGISFLDELSREAYNEGSHMMEYVEKYRKRFGFYPREVLADKIYCNRANRAELKALGIKLIAKPLGRPPALSIHVSPGERNPVEGKFGQAKTGYGLNRIKALLQGTSESWIATIILVLNLVKLAGVALLRPYLNVVESFSAWVESVMITSIEEFQYLKSFIRIDSSMKNINIKQVA